MHRFHFCFFFVTASCVLFSLSCAHRQDIHTGFRDVPQDSVVFDLNPDAFPASDIELFDVVKSGGLYYCKFYEGNSSWKRIHHRDYLMAFSPRDREPRLLPLPEDVKYLRSIFQRSDTLFAEMENWYPWPEFEQYEHYYCFDPDAWKWKPYVAPLYFGDSRYDDAEWRVLSAVHGDIGGMWFIDKNSSKEYLFWGLGGQVHRIDGSFYVVGKTRVYEITDPTTGFLCDSTSTYECIKAEQYRPFPYFESFYSSRGQNYLPVIQYDDFDPTVRIREDIWTDASVEFFSGYDKEVNADTLITGSFQSGGRLHCLLETPAATVLARWEDGRMATIHEFPKFEQLTRPSGLTGHAYPDTDRPGDEAFLILAKKGKGTYDLYEMTGEGNSLLRLTYSHGLEPVGQDGFESLFAFLLDNWGKLSLDDVFRVEESLGAKVSYKGGNEERNGILLKEILPAEESYHVDILTKQIGEVYFMDSDYWIAEADSSVPAVILSWRDAYLGSVFDGDAKADEIEEIVIRRCGPGREVSDTDRPLDYTEWRSGDQTIRFYRTYGLELAIY